MDAAVKESKTTGTNPENGNQSLMDSVATTEQYSVLPTANPKAKTPQECYDLFDMLKLTQEEFDRFTNENAIRFADTKLETVREWTTSATYPEFVCNRLLAIGSTSKITHKQKMNKFKLLTLMHYLLAMFR